MLQWFGNLGLQMPVGLPVVTQTGGGERDQKGGAGQLEPLVIEGSDGEAPPPNSINRRK